jgi:uncharacterized protein YbjQ (UPF0145 family)
LLQTGLITGGDAGNLMGQAHKWDEKAVNELRAQAEEMGARLRVGGKGGREGGWRGAGCK